MSTRARQRGSSLLRIISVTPLTALRGQRPGQTLLAPYPVATFAFFLCGRIPLPFTAAKCLLTRAHSDTLASGSDHVGGCWPVGSRWKSAGDFWDSLGGFPLFLSLLHLPAWNGEFSGRSRSPPVTTRRPMWRRKPHTEDHAAGRKKQPSRCHQPSLKCLPQGCLRSVTRESVTWLDHRSQPSLQYSPNEITLTVVIIMLILLMY